MAYPFGFYLTFLEFRTVLKEKCQCSYKTLNDSVKLTIDEQEPRIFKPAYLERTVNGRSIQCSIEGLTDNDIIMPTQVRRICRRLEIDPRELDIGLHLG